MSASWSAVASCLLGAAAAGSRLPLRKNETRAELVKNQAENKNEKSKNEKCSRSPSKDTPARNSNRRAKSRRVTRHVKRGRLTMRARKMRCSRSDGIPPLADRATKFIASDLDVTFDRPLVGDRSMGAAAVRSRWIIKRRAVCSITTRRKNASSESFARRWQRVTIRTGANASTAVKAAPVIARRQ